MREKPVTPQDTLDMIDTMFRNPVGHYRGPNRASDQIRESKEQQGKAWRPTRVLSRPTQDGIRMLHKSDPEMFDVGHLAQAFHISPIAVRKILKSKWRPTEEETRKHDRRVQKRMELSKASAPQANKLLMERLKSALQEQQNMPLRSDRSLLGDVLTQGYDPDTKELVHNLRRTAKRDALDVLWTQHHTSPTDSSSNPTSPEPVQRVRYEGVDAGSSTRRDLSSRRQDRQYDHGLEPEYGQVQRPGPRPGTERFREDTALPSSSSTDLAPTPRPGKGWALVDAAWCQVHVVTPEMRKTFVEEHQWEQRASGVVHEHLDGHADEVFPPPAPVPSVFSAVADPGPALEEPASSSSDKREYRGASEHAQARSEPKPESRSKAKSKAESKAESKAKDRSRTKSKA